MARKRFAEPVLKSWNEVELHMKEIGELDLELQGVEGTMNQKISDIKLEADLASRPLKDRKEKLAHEIKDFVETRRCEIDGKSRKLNFGQVGFRQSTAIIISKLASVLESLKTRGMQDCINVKETVNKDVLRTYPDDVIAAIGARKKVEDVFWLEPDYEKLK